MGPQLKHGLRGPLRGLQKTLSLAPVGHGTAGPHRLSIEDRGITVTDEMKYSFPQLRGDNALSQHSLYRKLWRNICLQKIKTKAVSNQSKTQNFCASAILTSSTAL